MEQIKTNDKVDQLKDEVKTLSMDMNSKLEILDTVAPKMLLQHVENDVRSVTGSNIRQLLLENNKTALSDIEFKGSIQNPVPEGDLWRIGLAFDSIDILNNVKFVPDFDKANVTQMLNNICIS